MTLLSLCTKSSQKVPRQFRTFKESLGEKKEAELKLQVILTTEFAVPMSCGKTGGMFTLT